MIKIYGDLKSGNCLKIKYLCDHLRIPYQWTVIDITAGATRTPQFLALNPAGQVPVIELEQGVTLAQSNAILLYLAENTPLLPESRLARANVNQWLFWEQYSHEPYIAVCRFHMLYEGRDSGERDAWRVERGERALDLMERHSRDAEWLAGGTFTIADISLLAYSRLAHEGGFDLKPRPAIRSWIARCEHELGLAPAGPVLDNPAAK